MAELKRAETKHQKTSGRTAVPIKVTVRHVEPARQSSFKIVVRRVERPFSGRPMDDLDWICQSLGFFETIDKDKTASAVFKEIVTSTDKGEALTSTALATRVGMSRGSVINHLNNLLRAGLITRDGRFYSARSRSMFRTIEEIEEDIDRVFEAMKRRARSIDREFGIVVRE
ncbi:helix-turn-helix domain-containing protein [Candidatus Micrarchaeota archaeon]|nr:helix-turn-helix domain-containing protein [Candidatus Micrarchaeota archaeon]MBU1939564.1 helix-turn-helix domain-containing protein [Candidatus Micrarchaeota archaeon]